MILPTSTDPVKDILLTNGCSINGCPAVGPSPDIMLMTPAGKPAFCTNSAIRNADNGVCSAVFNTHVLPVVNAGPSYVRPHQRQHCNSMAYGMVW
jgi:hypothetical protein